MLTDDDEAARSAGRILFWYNDRVDFTGFVNFVLFIAGGRPLLQDYGSGQTARIARRDNEGAGIASKTRTRTDYGHSLQRDKIILQTHLIDSLDIRQAEEGCAWLIESTCAAEDIVGMNTGIGGVDCARIIRFVCVRRNFAKF